MRIFILFSAIVLMSVQAPFASALDGDEIAAKSAQAVYYQASDGRSSVKMVITDALGRTRERDLSILRMNVPGSGEQKFFVYFNRPNDVKGTTYLVWKNPGKDDDRWLYLPALDLVRRVAASDKRSSFVGTNFAYEDISGRAPEQDLHEVIGEDDGYYELKSTPKDPGSVEFSYYRTRIDKTNFIPERSDYYDKSGKLYKTIEAIEVKDVQGYPTVVKMKASDLNAGSNTVSDFTDITYDVGLTDDIFTERYLRRPPVKYIK